MLIKNALKTIFITHLFVTKINQNCSDFVQCMRCRGSLSPPWFLWPCAGRQNAAAFSHLAIVSSLPPNTPPLYPSIVKQQTHPRSEAAKSQTSQLFLQFFPFGCLSRNGSRLPILSGTHWESRLACVRRKN